jgi:acetyl-CoA C-acetyltransferase
MTRAPYSLPKNPTAFGPSGNFTAYDTTLGWRYPNPALEALFPLEAMGATAENIVEQSRRGEIKGGEITREEQDGFALESQRRAINAMNNGYFKKEIVPVEVPQRKAEPVLVEHDEHPRCTRKDGSFEIATDPGRLAKLQGVFGKTGSVTAGNSSGLNDGACALVLMSKRKADELGIQPLARWVSSAAAGVDPRVMGLGPVEATRKALIRAGLSLEDIGLAELNEAFAAQAIAVMRELDLAPAITNVNGGAIALGHPLGCSGARILTTLLYEMKRRRIQENQEIRYGLATLCVGVGQGEATVIELLEPN